MAVENVNQPPKLRETDPKATPERKPEDVTTLENELKKTSLRREILQENKLLENIQSPPQPEAPFKVTGGISLGTIDIQEQQRQAREEAARAQKEAQEKVEKAEKAAQDARDALYNANMSHMREQLSAQIESLKNAINSGKQTDIFSELENIDKIAGRLGYQKGVSGSSNGSDFNAMLALKKLEQEMKREDRKFQLEMKKDERMWTLELKKLDQQAKESEARADAERNKYSFLTNLPEQLGGVMAKGLLARADNLTEAEYTVSKQPPKQVSKQVQGVDAYEGYAGEFPCPNCGTTVGVGPTTEMTMCAKCNQSFSINRIPAEDRERVNGR